jgi:hypothetical protein
MNFDGNRVLFEDCLDEREDTALNVGVKALHPHLSTVVASGRRCFEATMPKSAIATRIYNPGIF